MQSLDLRVEPVPSKAKIFKTTGTGGVRSLRRTDSKVDVRRQSDPRTVKGLEVGASSKQTRPRA